MAEKADLRRVHPELRAIVAEALACLAGSRHRWARPLGWVLRSRWVKVARLPGRLHGLTLVPLPVIWLDREFVEGALKDPLRRHRVVQTLMHEAAHQLGAVWPEWRNWIGDRRCYGPDRNAADAIVETIMRECYVATRYAGSEITYRSPLERIGLLRP